MDNISFMYNNELFSCTVTPGKPTVYTTEPEKTSQPILIQTHPTEMLRNSATKGKRLLQSKPKPKCNFRDINTFKNCYVVRNDKKTLLNSRKQCQKIGNINSYTVFSKKL